MTDMPAASPGGAGAMRPRLFDSAGYDREGAAWLRERLGRDVLLMQGPMGTALMSQMGAEEVPAAYWNVADPQEVERLHWLYRTVGADIMLANTFQASEPALARDGIDAPMLEVNRAGVACAQRAGAPCTLGSVGPCGLDWEERETPAYREVRAAYREQAHALLSAGAHGLVLETFTSLHDVEPALVGAFDVADGMPVLASFAIDDDCLLLGDGSPIEDACALAARFDVAAVGVNCCSISAATAAVPRMVRAVRLPVAVRPNAGLPRRTDEGELAWDEDPAAFVAACARWCDDGAGIVGSCCGAGIMTTCELSGYLEERFR